MSFYIGAHISREKTLLNTMMVITESGGNALQIFVGNPRSMNVDIVNLANYTSIAEKIQEYSKANDFKLVIHAPYTINLATQFKNGKRTTDIGDCKWIKCLLNQLEIANTINAVGVVVHVGKHTVQTYQEGLQNMFQAIKYVVDKMAKLQYTCKLIIETPAGQGTELLKRLEDFLAFYNSFSKEERRYLGICLDTAHVWSAGYELSEAYDLLFKKNAKDVAVIHYNNSEREKSAMVDRHAPILSGEIAKEDMEAFLVLLKRLDHKPIIILETPSEVKKELYWIDAILND